MSFLPISGFSGVNRKALFGTDNTSFFVKDINRDISRQTRFSFKVGVGGRDDYLVGNYGGSAARAARTACVAQTNLCNHTFEYIFG